MGIFGSKKKFGLKEALVVVEVKPNITADGAKTGAAFVEALGLSVTVVAEAEAKIGELETSVAEMQEGVKFAKTELLATPTIAGGAIDTLKAELKKLVEAIREVVLDKVDRIEDTQDKDIKILEHHIQVVKNKAETKGNKARTRGNKKAFEIENKIDKKIFEVEAQLKSDLADLKDRISSLESETKSAKAEISTLAKIKSLFV
ncbi:MAG: hypothetical protein Q8N42_00985 [bacterium]|nr:hypothetical protein [bacterium]